MAWHSSLGVWLEQGWVVILNHLWQSTICLLLAWGLVTWLRHAPAKFRLAVWLMALVKFALPTVVLMVVVERIGFDPAIYVAGPKPLNRNVVLQATQPLASDSLATYQPATSILPPPTKHRELYCWLTLVWVLGVVVIASQWFVSRWRLMRRLRQAPRTPWVPLHARLRDMQLWLGLHQDVEVVQVRTDVEPGVWRVWKPVVLLPDRVVEQLDEAELEHVLMHELAHVAQRDNLFCFLQRMLCLVFWFHPLVWWLHRQLSAEREVHCDEKVLRWSSCPEQYPRSLWKVAQLQFGWTVTGISHFAGANLKRRMQFMSQLNYTAWTRKHKFAASATMIVLSCSAFALGLFAPPEKLSAKMQDASYLYSVNLPYENAAEIPLVITAAEMRVSDGRNLKTIRGGVLVSGDPSMRLVRIYARLTNQSARRIKGYVLEYGHPQERRKMHRLYEVTQRTIQSTKIAPSLIEPQSSFLFDEYAPMSRVGDDEATKIYLGQFQLKVVGIMFESDQDWYWTAAAQSDTFPQVQTKSFHRPFVVASDGAMPIPRDDIPETSPQNNAAPYRDEILTASDATTRPRILYQEKANYTPEARDAKVSGIVALNAIFGADGNIYSIRIIRGLPLGLNDEAIKALQKIRFQPATKDGQPVSVRMGVEYSFVTDK